MSDSRWNGFTMCVIIWTPFVISFFLVAHENSVKAIHRMSGITKEKFKKLLLYKKSAKKHDDIKNTIPASKAHVSPLDYEDDLYPESTFSKWGESTEDIRKDRKTIEQESVEEEGEIEHLKNQTVHEKKLRGDVFCKCYFIPPKSMFMAVFDSTRPIN